jgi:cyclic pyranopterin phosphate synthase
MESTITIGNRQSFDSFHRPAGRPPHLGHRPVHRAAIACLSMNMSGSTEEILTFEEITRLARLFVLLGVDEIRLTGGEPLARTNLEVLVGQLSVLAGLKDLSLTTNGVFLAASAAALAAAGLKRINVSIDTLDSDRFRQITKRGDLEKVLEGLFAAKRAGLHPVKINTVIERGVMMAYPEASRVFTRAWIRSAIYRVHGCRNSNSWKSERMVSKKEILAAIVQRYPLREVGRNRAQRRP